MIRIYTDYVRLPNNHRQWAAKITIDTADIDLDQLECLNVHIDSVATEDAGILADYILYMQYGIYMDDTFNMNNQTFSQPVISTQYGVMDIISNTNNTIFVALDPEIIRGERVLLFQLEYGFNPGCAQPVYTSNYTLGYLPIPTDPIYGYIRMNTTDRRLYYRGENLSHIYNDTNKEREDDLSLMYSKDTQLNYIDTTNILRLNYIIGKLYGI